MYIATVLLTILASVSAVRLNIKQEVEDSNALMSISDKPVDRECAQKLADIKSIQPRNMGMATKDKYKCDSYLIGFVQEVKGRYFNDKDLKMQLWFWKIRPGRNSSAQAHHAAIKYHGGQYGIDTHFFTVVDLGCSPGPGTSGRYWVFDTVQKGGKDVTDESGALSEIKVKEGYTFEFAEDLNGEVSMCDYDDCVVECKSRFVKSAHMKASKLASCLGAIKSKI
mmetsp:Transcript_1213/g.2079  ORF Transcript_1213/g.2079 Transcript_1213/m.2079 type:complete len:224 (+) Transcript_1213:71-742(+)